jgi:cyclic pyranopterin phosphate synthase
MTATLDQLSRALTDLRISVTDRCNLRCPYCLPREAFERGFSFMARSELLTFEEIARVRRVLAGLGVTKVRLTGGEPLLRGDLDRLVAMLAAIEGIEDVALTTNGTLLAAKAGDLKEAGLGRVTVSLDALDENVLHAMSGTRLSLASVLAGIEAAKEAGLGPVKINAVIRRGVNDHCVLKLADHFRYRPETLRFIEYMDVGNTNGWQAGEVVPASELLATIAEQWPLEALPPVRVGEVATRYRYLDGAGEIGFIRSISQPFCADCTRARMSAEGKLYTCLFATRGVDVRAMLRGSLSDRALERELRKTWQARTDRYSAERLSRAGRRNTPTPGPDASVPRGRAPKIEMSYIGG